MRRSSQLPIWTAYEPLRDAAAKAPEKWPWWKRQRVWAPTLVALVVAAPLIIGDVELFVLNLVGLGTGRCCSGGSCLGVR